MYERGDNDCVKQKTVVLKECTAHVKGITTCTYMYVHVLKCIFMCGVLRSVKMTFW